MNKLALKVFSELKIIFPKLSLIKYDKKKLDLNFTNVYVPII